MDFSSFKKWTINVLKTGYVAFSILLPYFIANSLTISAISRFLENFSVISRRFLCYFSAISRPFIGIIWPFLDHFSSSSRPFLVHFSSIYRPFIVHLSAIFQSSTLCPSFQSVQGLLLVGLPRLEKLCPTLKTTNIGDLKLFSAL